MIRRVFVSYSRNDLETVTQLIEDLQAVGVDAWHDQTLSGGQRWWDNILANIRECDILVFALSPASWESEACKSELTYADRLGKPIIPVLVADGINLNLLTAPLNEIQVMDYRQHDKGAAFALVRSINIAATAGPLPDPLPAPPPVPISYLGTLKERIDSAGPLGPQDQNLLFLELEEAIGQGRSRAEIRDLLLSLKRRDDLLARVAAKIDTALKGLGEEPPVKPHKEATRETTVSMSSAEMQASEHRPAAASKLCSRCHTPVPPGSTFCFSCGAALAEPEQPVPLATVPHTGKNVQPPTRSNSRRYVCSAGDTPHLIADVKGWLDSQGFDSQQMSTDTESVLLQIKKRGGWRGFVGMATSLNIVFHQSNGTLTVEIGAGEWIDKAAVGTVSLFILWPLALTAGYGAWEQMRMPEKIFHYIGNRLVHT